MNKHILFKVSDRPSIAFTAFLSQDVDLQPAKTIVFDRVCLLSIIQYDDV